jgi:hypothetical protein
VAKEGAGRQRGSGGGQRTSRWADGAHPVQKHALKAGATFKGSGRGSGLKVVFRGFPGSFTITRGPVVSRRQQRRSAAGVRNFTTARTNAGETGRDTGASAAGVWPAALPRIDGGVFFVEKFTTASHPTGSSTPPSPERTSRNWKCTTGRLIRRDGRGTFSSTSAV